MSYKDELFAQCGQPCPTANINISAWLHSPDDCKSFEQIRRNDESAAQLIAECKRMVTLLIEYRQALAARYNALATMPSKDSIELHRYRRQSGITYALEQFTEYADGTKVLTAKETFVGKDRHAAIKRFAELRHERPGIQYTMDIEKSPWEQ